MSVKKQQPYNLVKVGIYSDFTHEIIWKTEVIVVKNLSKTRRQIKLTKLYFSDAFLSLFNHGEKIFFLGIN